MYIQRATLPYLIARLARILSSSIYVVERQNTAINTSQIVPVPDSTYIQKKPEKDTTQSEPRVVAYFFHMTCRCYSCKKIETYAKEAIEAGFADELANGTLEFHSMNIQEPENRHFIQDYHLYTKSWFYVK